MAKLILALCVSFFLIIGKFQVKALNWKNLMHGAFDFEFVNCILKIIR